MKYLYNSLSKTAADDKKAEKRLLAVQNSAILFALAWRKGKAGKTLRFL